MLRARGVRVWGGRSIRVRNRLGTCALNSGSVSSQRRGNAPQFCRADAHGKCRSFQPDLSRMIVDRIEHLIYRGSVYPQELGECAGVDFPHVGIAGSKRVAQLAQDFKRAKGDRTQGQT